MGNKMNYQWNIKCWYVIDKVTLFNAMSVVVVVVVGIKRSNLENYIKESLTLKLAVTLPVEDR